MTEQQMFISAITALAAVVGILWYRNDKQQTALEQSNLAQQQQAKQSAETYARELKELLTMSVRSNVECIKVIENNTRVMEKVMAELSKRE